MENTEYKLNEKQKRAYNAMMAGKNIFLTGPSGTGKSTVINLFKNTSGKNKTIGITSTTGISALLIGGTTIHSYLGIGLGDGTAEELIKRIEKNQKAKKRWLYTDTLIIDEVSMLSPVLLDKLDKVGRVIRGGGRMISSSPLFNRPFGGMQIIFSGDFLQLPVVGSDDFAFESKAWNDCVEEVICLTEIIRQDDIVFQNLLNKCRFGDVTEDVIEILSSRVNVELKNDLGIKPTRIHTTNAAVDEINDKELNKLATATNTEFYEYIMEVYFYEFVANREQALEKCKKNCIAPETLQLCKGAQVMLLHNLDLDCGLANGSRGVVVEFLEDLPVVRFMNGEERVIDYHTWETEEAGKKQVKISQLPLKLAWAITVHKSQGCTLDLAEIDLSKTFAYGQAYVALSRVKSLDGLNIICIDFEKIRAHPKCTDYYNNLE